MSDFPARVGIIRISHPDFGNIVQVNPPIQVRKEKNVIITVEQIEALRPYIEDIENLISADDVDVLLDAVDDVVVDNIVSHNDEPDEEGRRIQRIYDDIAAQNHVYWD